MKLKDYLKSIGKEMPKKKEVFRPTDKQVGEGAYYDLAEILGFNQAIDLCGEIEVGGLDEDEMIRVLERCPG